MSFFFRAVSTLVFLALGIAFSTSYLVNRAVEDVVYRNAIDKAEHWGSYLAANLPDLDQLVATGIPTDEQQETIREVRQIGSIFRFKLFDNTGRLSLVSDDANLTGPAGLADLADPEPKKVAETRVPMVDVYDGTAKPDRPDLYAEAYIPLVAPGGQVFGVAEVYVDQTATAAYFVESFRTFGVLLMVLFATVCILGGSAFFTQRYVAHKSRRDAEFLARFDPLTGVMNRREFLLQAEWAMAEEKLSVVCYLDLDNFKTINDKYGHAAGDAFLVHVSQVLRTHCQPQDLLARFGGDEFVLGFHGVDTDAAVHRLRSILKDCGDDVGLEGKTLRGSVSIGLAMISANDGLEVALKNADAALYHAKSAGRNDFAVYGDEMGEQIRQRHALEERLREATRRGDFEIHYQPLVDGPGGQLIGHEALLRLSYNNGTPIPPSVFVPLAEELGLIEDIGAWTLKTATRDIASLGGDHLLAINLSSMQFQSGELVDTVREALCASGLAASRLELEITESLLLDDSLMVAMQIDALKEMGVAIAMDDFGTGFSSLGYLWKYGFDRLKIDRSFVSALESNSPRSREIIETVVMLAARLGMNVTAEGVETAKQAELLADLGCDVLQGYHFGEPSPLDVSGRVAKTA